MRDGSRLCYRFLFLYAAANVAFSRCPGSKAPASPDSTSHLLVLTRRGAGEGLPAYALSRATEFLIVTPRSKKSHISLHTKPEPEF